MNERHFYIVKPKGSSIYSPTDKKSLKVVVFYSN